MSLSRSSRTTTESRWASALPARSIPSFDWDSSPALRQTLRGQLGEPCRDAPCREADDLAETTEAGVGTGPSASISAASVAQRRANDDARPPSPCLWWLYLASARLSGLRSLWSPFFGLICPSGHSLWSAPMRHGSPERGGPCRHGSSEPSACRSAREPRAHPSREAMWHLRRMISPSCRKANACRMNSTGTCPVLTPRPSPNAWPWRRCRPRQSSSDSHRSAAPRRSDA